MLLANLKVHQSGNALRGTEAGSSALSKVYTIPAERGLGKPRRSSWQSAGGPACSRGKEQTRDGRERGTSRQNTFDEIKGIGQLQKSRPTRVPVLAGNSRVIIHA